MRRTLLTGLVAIGLGIGAGSLVWPQRAECLDCPVNYKCNGDLECNTLYCALKCVQVDRQGGERRCMFVAQ